MMVPLSTTFLLHQDQYPKNLPMEDMESLRGEKTVLTFSSQF